LYATARSPTVCIPRELKTYVNVHFILGEHPTPKATPIMIRSQKGFFAKVFFGSRCLGTKSQTQTESQPAKRLRPSAAFFMQGRLRPAPFVGILMGAGFRPEFGMLLSDFICRKNPLRKAPSSTLRGIHNAIFHDGPAGPVGLVEAKIGHLLEIVNPQAILSTPKQLIN
jgi:hypothetical protein